MHELVLSQSAVATLSDAAKSTLKEYGILPDQSAIATLEANLGGAELDVFSFDTITLPLGGAEMWQINTLDGVQAEKEITGIITWWTERRRYYSDVYTGDNRPPDCFSNDLIHGEGEPGGFCSECPLNQWGSGIGPDGEPSRGKACSQYRLLFINRGEEAILPDVVIVPPTSLANSRQYFFSLIKQNLPHYAVVTKITLERGQPVSKMVFSLERRLEPEIAHVVASYTANLRGILERTASAFTAEGEV